MSKEEEEEETTTTKSLLRQTLMTVDECFVYKIPPMATSTGHRAEQWDLANPLQTCGFQVERRDNDLYLLFTLEDHTKLFCLSKLHETSNFHHDVEKVVDSSRYFVTHLYQPSKQQANDKASTSTSSTSTSSKGPLIGFGFRDRDVALDLIGNLQQFQQSIQRELKAKNAGFHQISVPQLGKDEKIHISFGGTSTSTTKTRKSTSAASGSGSGGGSTLLLKKPPKYETPPSTLSPVAATATVDTSTESHDGTTTTTTKDVRISLGGLDLDAEWKNSRRKLAIQKSDDDDEDGNNNIAEGNEEVDDDSDGAVACDDDGDVIHHEPVTGTTTGAGNKDDDGNDDDDDDDWNDFQQA